MSPNAPLLPALLHNARKRSNSKSVAGVAYESVVCATLGLIRFDLTRRKLERGDGGLDLIGAWRTSPPCRVGVQCKHRSLPSSYLTQHNYNIASHTQRFRKTIPVRVIRELEASLGRWKKETNDPTGFLGIIASNVALSKDAQRWLNISSFPLAYAQVDNAKRLAAFRINNAANKLLPNVHVLQKAQSDHVRGVIVFDNESIEY